MNEPEKSDEREEKQEEKQEEGVDLEEQLPVTNEEETNQTVERKSNKRVPELLPAVTPEIEAEYRKEQEARSNGHPGKNREEPHHVCGIPYYLFMTLVALGVAVIVGTVLAVIYYDPNKFDVTPDTASPTLSLIPSMTPTASPTLSLAPTTMSPTISFFNDTTSSESPSMAP